jgi:hypothetical protein
MAVHTLTTVEPRITQAIDSEKKPGPWSLGTSGRDLSLNEKSGPPAHTEDSSYGLSTATAAVRATPAAPDFQPWITRINPTWGRDSVIIVSLSEPQKAAGAHNIGY